VRYYEASATIGAAPEAVWAVLTDAAAWPSWDSGVQAVEGRIVLGETITVRSHAAPGRAFPVTVADLAPPHSLRLAGGMPLGLFRGVRTYTVSAEPGDQAAFHMREQYTGPLVPLIWRAMPDLGPSFSQFAQGLKRRVESGG
jgi:hypothetical protein